jgi:hypothetical protein
VTGAHVAGATLGATLGAVLASVLNKYGFNVDEATAALIGSFLLAAGVGLGHIVSTEGLWPAFKRVFAGPPPKS